MWNWVRIPYWSLFSEPNKAKARFFTTSYYKSQKKFVEIEFASADDHMHGRQKLAKRLSDWKVNLAKLCLYRFMKMEFILSGNHTNFSFYHWDFIFHYFFASHSSGRDRVLILWNIQEKKSLRILPIYECAEGTFLIPESSTVPLAKDSNGIYAASAGEKFRHSLNLGDEVWSIWCMSRSILSYQRQKKRVACP